MDTSCSPFILADLPPLWQTVIALDLYLAYLRGAFNTCYYCAVVTDHLEELQRKCIKHIRKPMSKMLLQEVQAAEAQKVENDVKVEDNAEPAPKEKESSAKEKENRDWKRNGTCQVDCRWLLSIDSLYRRAMAGVARLEDCATHRP